jgi:hypothetical protein
MLSCLFGLHNLIDAKLIRCSANKKTIHPTLAAIFSSSARFAAFMIVLWLNNKNNYTQIL